MLRIYFPSGLFNFGRIAWVPCAIKMGNLLSLLSLVILLK